MNKQIKLDIIKKEHLDQLLKWRNSEDIYNWCRQKDLLTYENHEKWFNSLCDNQTTKMYLILLYKINEYIPIGVCGLTDMDLFNQRAEFSLYIGPEYQGKNYGEEALRLLLDHAFYNYPFKTIWGETFNGNPALKTFLKIGFKQEGTRRNFYYKCGDFVDAHLVSITKDEFYA